MSSQIRSRFLLAGLALLAALSIAVVSLNNSADAGALVPGDATCNGIFNESDILPALEEIADVGEGAACPHNANVLCNDPLDSLDVLVLLHLLTDIEPDATLCLATPTPGPTGVTPVPTGSSPTPTLPTVTSTSPAETATVTPGTVTPAPTTTPTTTPAATPTQPATPTATLNTDEADLEAVTIAPVDLPPTPVPVPPGGFVAVDFNATLNNNGPAPGDDVRVSLRAEQTSGNGNPIIIFQWQNLPGDTCWLFLGPATCGGSNPVDELGFTVDLPVNTQTVVSRELQFKCSSGMGLFEITVTVHVFHPTANDPDTNNQEKTFTFSGTCPQT